MKKYEQNSKTTNLKTKFENIIYKSKTISLKLALRKGLENPYEN